MGADNVSEDTDGASEDTFSQFFADPDIPDSLVEQSSISDSPEAAVSQLIAELDALEGAGYDTSDAGTGLADSEIAPFLDISEEEASESGRDFADDSQGESGMPG